MAETAIVGAGMAGLSAARFLQQHGHSVVVFDKGRGPGGRAARRRHDRYRFDHGAQYFTVRDPLFARNVRTWAEEGVVAEWKAKVISLEADGRYARPPARWYVGVPGMSSLPTHIGRDVTVRCGCRVVRIGRSESGWTLSFEDGTNAGPFENLLITAPAPQTSTLLAGECPSLAGRVETVRMLPCWATMLAFEQRLATDFDAAFVRTSGPLRWIARDSSKPDRPDAETWVVHTDTGWSVEHLERSPEWVAERMTEAFAKLVGHGAEEPVLSTAHRWRYAFVERPVETLCLFDPDLRVGAAGDWCLGPRIEAAFRSGVTAAARILGLNAEAPASARAGRAPTTR